MKPWIRHLDWADQTTLHPIAAAVLVLLVFAVLALKRRWALAPILVLVCFIPSAQRIVVAGLDFDLIRIMTLAGWVRVLIRGEQRGYIWKSIDTVFVLYVIVGFTIMMLQHGSMPVLIQRLGWTYNAVGLYFLFRCLIRTWDDVEAPFVALGVLSIPVAMAFLIEYNTGRNLFNVFGSVPEFTAERAGRLRCQGPFAHPIHAGCFWATAVPVFIAMMASPSRLRYLAPVSAICALTIVVLTASSTPIVSLAFGFLGLAIYPIRLWLPALRWAVLAIVVALHVTMNAPVWHLLARIRVVGASSAYHRFRVIDQTIANFGDWWLLGSKSTLHWGFYDITNYYVVTAVQGGLLTLLLLLVLLVQAFRGMGRMIRLQEGSGYHQLLVWAVGVSLFVHCINFLAVAYYAELLMLWYLQLGLAASLVIPAAAVVRRP